MATIPSVVSVELQSSNIMNANALHLRPLQVEDETQFKRAVEEFQRENPQWRFAFHFDPASDFPDYVRRLENWSRGLDLPDDYVPNSYFVGVVADRIVGRLSLRHQLNDFLVTRGGHIGYGVLPGQRGRGYATAMLQQALPLCAQLGLSRVLLTCDVDHVASRRVIEKCGGVLEGVTDSPSLDIQQRRYWIAIKG